MVDIEELKEQNKLTLNENDLIYVKPLSQIDWQTYPLDNLDDCLLLTLDEYLDLRDGTYIFNENLDGLIANEIDNEPQRIYVKPIDEYNFEIDKEHRFEESIELTIEQLIKLKKKEYKFNCELNGLEDNKLEK